MKYLIPWMLGCSTPEEELVYLLRNVDLDVIGRPILQVDASLDQDPLPS